MHQEKQQSIDRLTNKRDEQQDEAHKNEENQLDQNQHTSQTNKVNLHAFILI
jgi:hypothetical protein